MGSLFFYIPGKDVDCITYFSQVFPGRLFTEVIYGVIDVAKRYMFLFQQYAEVSIFISDVHGLIKADLFEYTTVGQKTHRYKLCIRMTVSFYCCFFFDMNTVIIA